LIFLRLSSWHFEFERCRSFSLLFMRVYCLFFLLHTSIAFAQNDAKPQYIRASKVTDIITKPHAGVGLFGGGKDQDVAFKWMCEKANGGDFLILRATGTDAYNPYLQKLCPELNSVATLIIHSREAANDLATREALQHAEAIFISGGDQSNYVKLWRGTAVTDEINAAAKRGVPIGGTSAGLAVLGEYAYSAMNDTVQSADALANPFHERVTIEHDFLRLSQMAHVITDSHFAKRDRMGRLVAFVARIYKDGDREVRGIGIDERSVVLLEPNGNATVVGEGQGAYLMTVLPSKESLVPADPIPPQIKAGAPLQFRVGVLHVPVGRAINFNEWTSPEAERYTLTASDGKLTSSKADRKAY
jgi:cyanophycinase